MPQISMRVFMKNNLNLFYQDTRDQQGAMNRYETCKWFFWFVASGPQSHWNTFILSHFWYLLRCDTEYTDHGFTNPVVR